MRRFGLILLVAACTSPTDAHVPAVVSVVPLAAGPMAYDLAITLREAAAVTVEYTAGDGPRLVLELPAARTHVARLSRLRTGRTYEWTIVGTTHAGSFTTPPLPADLAAVRFTATGTPTVPLVLVHLFRSDGFRGYAIVDAQGEVVWYFRTLDTSFGMTRRPDGSFVFLDRLRGLVHVATDGRVLHELPTDTLDREMHHDAVVTPANTILFLAFDDRFVDGVAVKGEAIWEWTPETGAVVKRWSAWDHLDVRTDRGPRFDREWLHANALAVGPRGNVLVSLHYLNQVLSIAPDWSRIEWRLGGVNPTIALPPEAQFTGQHSVREVAVNRVVLFDNRIEQRDGSRALELMLNGDHAIVEWEWSPAMPNFAAIVSSARRLRNGNTLIGFGAARGVAGATGPTEVYEVPATGDPVWHLLVENTTIMFRAEPVKTVAGEREALRER
jgi:hypothetical protein